MLRRRRTVRLTSIMRVFSDLVDDLCVREFSSDGRDSGVIEAGVVSLFPEMVKWRGVKVGLRYGQALNLWYENPLFTD